MDIQDLQDKGVGFCFLDSAEKVSVPARYGHGAKGLAPSKGINKLFSL